MKRQLVLAALFGVAATAVTAEGIAPSDVMVTEYGEVMESLTGVAGDPVRGEEVMTSRGLGNCIACHQVSALDEYDFHGEVGPMLDGVGSRWDAAGLRGIVVNAKGVFPESVMPAFYRTTGFTRPGNAFTGRAAEGELSPLLTAQDVEDVVAYLQTLTD